MIFLKRLLCFVLCLCVFLFSLTSCKDTGNNQNVKDPQIQAKAYYEYFDTKSIIYSYKGDSEAEFKANCTVVESLLEEYHKLFDIYYEYSGINNIKTINKNAGKASVEVDEKLIDFLLYCKEV